MYSVVIVDDNIQNRDGLANQINWSHYGIGRVFTAANGVEGISCIKDNRPLIALVDVEMPLMNGLEMAKRAQMEKMETHFIFISAFDKVDYIRSAFRLGAVDYIDKPVDFVELERVIGNVIVSHQAKQNELRQIKSYLGEGKAPHEAAFPIFANIRDEIRHLMGSDRPWDNGQQTQQVVEHIVHEINRSYVKSVSVNDLLTGLYISPNHANRIFKKATGQSIYSFLQRKRIYEAQKLLLNTKLRIHDISERVGFNDASHFSAVFKSLTGYAPKDYVSQFKTGK